MTANVLSRPNTARLTRFFSRVTVQPTGCWKFATLNGRGYGVFGSQNAHRVSYTWFVGRIPDGLHIDHLCFTKSCVNPAHLEAVTLTENNRRGHIWTRTGRCFKGHLLTPDNIYYYRRNSARPHERTCLKCRLVSRRRWVAKRSIDTYAAAGISRKYIQAHLFDQPQLEKAS